MKLWLVAAAVALVFGFAQSALAGVVSGAPPAFSLDVTSSIGLDVVHVKPTLTANPDGTYSASGEALAPSFSVLFNFTLSLDPAVVGSFSLINQSSVPQTFSVSASLGVLPIAGPTRIGGFYGETTYTDTSGDKTVGLGTAGTNPFYRALIDSVSVQDLGSFSFDPISGDEAGIQGTLSQEIFGAPIPNDPGPGVVGSIGVAFPGFMLTQGDKVEVPFEFVVVPEPTFAELFAICFAVILCAFARETASSASSDPGRILPTGG